MALVEVSWREAWQHALYGPRGFYRTEAGPAGHFTTSTHGPAGASFARAIALLADQEHATHVLDIGCGRGELLTHLHAVRPDLRLSGVDVVDRPTGLPDAISWTRSPGGPGLPDTLRDLQDVLVVANEWLDVVPCTIAEVVAPGTLEVVLVDPATGVESPHGGAPTVDELDWCSRHWPVGDLAVGARVEIGLARDQAWGDLLSRIRRGTALAVDYGHTAGGRPTDGTLAAYRSGGLAAPVPDGTCDLTAHLAVDSLAADSVLSQREALRSLGLTGGLPHHDLAATDPAGYLAAIASASGEATLTRADGLGAFWWVLRRVSM